MRSNDDYMKTFEQTLQDENLTAHDRTAAELALKALKGDKAAYEALVLHMADIDTKVPAGGTTVTMGQKLADPVELVQQSLLNAIYGDFESLQELGRRRMRRYEEEIAGPDPSAIEKTLAQQAAVCWMQLYHYEKQYDARLNNQPQTTLEIQQEEFYQKRVARAQRRLEGAIKTLAQVRKLALPTMQINVAEKQVNLGNGQMKIEEAQVNVLLDQDDEGE